MALQTETFKQQLINLFEEMRTKEEPDDEYYADQFTKLIEQFVKSGVVNTQVNTTGGSGTGVGSIT